MGIVRTRSINCKESWILAAVKGLTTEQWQTLQSINPIEFGVGNIYIILPSSILTFLSVQTTYCDTAIILYQVIRWHFSQCLKTQKSNK